MKTDRVSASSVPVRRLTEEQIRDACYFDPLDGDESPRRYIHDKVIVSRGNYECFNCCGPIRRGDHCRSIKVLFTDDREFWTQRVCADCCAVAKDFEAVCYRYMLHKKKETRNAD